MLCYAMSGTIAVRLCIILIQLVLLVWQSKAENDYSLSMAKQQRDSSGVKEFFMLFNFDLLIYLFTYSNSIRHVSDTLFVSDMHIIDHRTSSSQLSRFDPYLTFLLPTLQLLCLRSPIILRIKTQLLPRLVDTKQSIVVSLGRSILDIRE